MRNLIFEEVKKCIVEIRELEKVLSQEEIEKEREKVVDTVVRLIDLIEISRMDGLLGIEEWMERDGENWEPELKKGIPCIVDAQDRDDVQQMLWQRYVINKLHGYEALRYLLNMRGVYDIQRYSHPSFTREFLCSMLPDEIDALYRKRPKIQRESLFAVEEEYEDPFDDFLEFARKHEDKKGEDKKEDAIEAWLPEIEEEKAEETDEKSFLDMYTPAKIESMINEYIIGQPELVKAVADFLFYHMLRVAHPELPMRNLLIAGSSGTGKTEVFRCIQKLFTEIQIKIADGSRVTKEGWTGNYKLKDILNSDIDILVIDEADKLCKPSFASGGNNVSEEMQGEFLKLLEGEYENTGRGKGALFQPNKISIVFVGAFENIRKKKKSVSEMRSIGFSNDFVEAAVCHEITDEDLIEYGMMPELVGRIASKVTTNDLTNEDYISILKNPHSRLSSLIGVVEQYGIQVEDILSKEKIIELIETSKSNRTGFRWMSAQVENMVLDCLREQGLKMKKEIKAAS